MDPTLRELVGYVASALVVLSLAMSSTTRLRIINLAGAGLFVVYGLLIGSWPIVITNGIIAVLDVWFLWKAWTDRVHVAILPIDPASPYLGELLRFYGDDIARFQPTFDGVPEGPVIAFLLLRDAIPAGVFLARPSDDGSAEVVLDYVTPAFRDLKVGRWLYGPGSTTFVGAGIDRLVTDPGTERHRRYLRRMGFRPVPDGRWVLDLGTRRPSRV